MSLMRARMEFLRTTCMAYPSGEGVSLAFVRIGAVLRYSLQLHSPEGLRGGFCQLVPVVGMRFREDVREVEFHSAHSDLQQEGDFPIRKTPAHQIRNLITAKR